MCHCLSCLLIGLCVTVYVAWWWVVCYKLCVSLYRLLTDRCVPPYELLADHHVCHSISCLLTAMCHCMRCLLMAVCVTVYIACWALCVSLYELFADCWVHHCMSCLLTALWHCMSYLLCTSLYELFADCSVLHCMSCLLTTLCPCMSCLLTAVCHCEITLCVLCQCSSSARGASITITNGGEQEEHLWQWWIWCFQQSYGGCKAHSQRKEVSSSCELEVQWHNVPVIKMGPILTCCIMLTFTWSIFYQLSKYSQI